MWRKLILIIVLMFILPGDLLAVEIFHDDFTDLEKVDVLNTTAHVDTAAGWVALPRQPIPSAVDVRAEGWEDAVASRNGIEVYTYDDATGRKIKNEELSIPEATDSIGVACRDDVPVIWVLTPTSLAMYSHVDGSMQTSPSRSVSGLSGVLSASAWKGLDRVVLLTKTPDNKGKIEVYRDAGEINLYLVMDTGIEDPVAVCTVPGTPDFLFAARTGVYYYAFDDATGGFLLHPCKQATNLSGVLTVSAKDENAFLVAEGNDANYYLWTEPSGASKIAQYSRTEMSGLLSVSMKPRADEYATLTAGGNQDYWMYDDLSGCMKRNGILSRSGISLNLQHLSPAEYRSTAFSTTKNYDNVRISAVTDIPEGTGITFYVSSDGGAGWTETANGDWTTVPSGNCFSVKAVLFTTDPGVTPKILSITLEASALEIKNLKVLAVAANYPDQQLPTNNFPVTARIGAEVLFEVETEGYAQSVQAAFSLGPDEILIPLRPTGNFESNAWRGSYVVPCDAVEGSFISIVVKAQKESSQKTLAEERFIRITGNVLDVMDIILTQ